MTRSERLASLKAQYNDSESVWDIGCDHGLLGLSFANEPKVKAINLVDPSKPVIEALRLKINDSDIPYAKIYHEKGQVVQLDQCSKTIFIAGMGGKEIRDIIVNLIPQMSMEDRLVISPHRNILLLREFLKDSELRLEDEFVMYEDGQFYLIMNLSKNSERPRIHEYGEKLWATEIGQKYRAQQLLHFGLHQDPVSLRYLEYLRDAKKL